MLSAIDEYLDRITMYRLLLYYLIALVLIAMGLGAMGALAISPLAIAKATVILVVVCWTVNQAFARFLKLPINSDSTYITALILALIISPNFSSDGLTFLIAAGALAIASKYLLTIRGRHVFNPAAVAVVLTALGPEQSASWWIGNSAMLPFVIIGGLLLIRRIRRIEMAASFYAAALVIAGLHAMLTHANVASILHQIIFDSALFFMGYVMLPEPLTSPTTRKYQILYGVLTGILFLPQIHVASFYSTPERALIVGNIFAFIVNPKVRLFPRLVQKTKLTPDVMDFEFAPQKKFSYQPGQYMEFTLPHTHIDSRGQRRYFTLASSPTEPNIRLGVKFYPKGSSFKRAMLKADEHTSLIAASLGGDFVLPRDPERKVTLIAGGIGITPYRSMIKYLLDKDERRPITLLYAASTADDIAYMDVFEQARHRLDINTIYALTKAGESLPDKRFRAGRITPALIKAEVPDYPERLFYISGPHEMVVAIEATLKNLGVHRTNIKTDFFSGYA